MQRFEPLAAARPPADATQAAYRRLIDRLDALAAQQRAAALNPPSPPTS